MKSLRSSLARRLLPLIAASVAAGCGNGTDAVAPQAELDAVPITPKTQATANITINATTLTKQGLMLPGLLTFSSSALTSVAAPLNMQLPFETAFGELIGYYSVDSSGHVQYDPSLDKTVFTGRGTNTLGIVAHPVTVATPGMDPFGLVLGGFANITPPTSQALALPAATFPVNTGIGTSVGFFSVKPDGTLTYDSSLERTVFIGAGTSTLTVVAHTITIDAHQLQPAATLMIAGLPPLFSSATPHTLHLPAANNYVLDSNIGTYIGSFSILGSGLVDYASNMNNVFSGRATTTLDVRSASITIDATAKGAGTFNLGMFGNFDRSVTHTLTVPMGTPITYSDDTFTLQFSVGPDGLEWAGTDDRASGRDTLTLRIFPAIPFIIGHFSNRLSNKGAGVMHWNDAQRTWALDTWDPANKRFAGAQWGDLAAACTGICWFGSDGTPLPGDYNGDGLSDLLMWNASTSTWEMLLANKSGTGFTGSAWANGAPGSAGPTFIGDLDGDGKTDVFMMSSASNWEVNLSTGSGWKQQLWANSQFALGGSVLTGDFNGDKKTDLIRWDPSYNLWRVSLSTGSGWTAANWLGHPGSDGDIHVADLNGDGKADIFMFRASDSTWSVNLSTGSGFTQATWQGEPPGTARILTGDLNGDGKTDVFMFSNLQWLVNLSTGSGFTPQVWNDVGGPQDQNELLVADLDGDGKTDNFFPLPSMTSWQVNFSSGSSFGAANIPDAVPPVPTYSVKYNGGDLMGMGAPVNVYLILYGNFSAASQAYYTNFLKTVGASAYFATVGEYADHTGTHIHTGLNLMGIHYDTTYSHGKSIDGAPGLGSGVEGLLGDIFNSDSTIKRDSNAVYLMVFDDQVTITNAGSDFCAYHATSAIGAQKYAVMPMNLAELSDCQPGEDAGPGPTGEPIANKGDAALMSMMAHEIIEAMTDPDVGSGSGYVSATSFTTLGGNEVMDVCSYQDGFGGTGLVGGDPTLPFNVKLGNQFYRLQAVFDQEQANDTGICVQSAFTTPTNNFIGVQSATYGENCGNWVDVTASAGAACNNKASCSYTLTTAAVPSDPDPGCTKTLTVQWACAGGPKLQTFAGEALNNTVKLSCP